MLKKEKKKEIIKNGEVMTVKTASDSNIKEIVNSPSLSMIKFGATWCPPCKALKPTLDRIAQERSDVSIYEMDIDDNPVAPQLYRISNVPTMILFFNGSEVSRLSGNQPKTVLENWINGESARVS